MKDYVLVIGSVILDIIGTYPKDEENLVNKTGEIKYSIGGVAYNVAANLSSKDVNVSLLTCLKKNSLSTHAIKGVLNQSKIDVKYIFEVDDINEIGYVAHFAENELVTGITSSQIERKDLQEYVNLEKAVKNSKFVAVDTNISDTQIKIISHYCLKHNKSILVNVVSDAKVKRIYKGEFPIKFAVVCLNSEEIKAVGFESKNEYSPFEAKQICKELNANCVFIQRGSHGYNILKVDGTCDKVSNSFDSKVVNTSGAGDALFSALCFGIFHDIDIDSLEIKSKVQDWVSSILNQHSSNFGVAMKPIKNGKDSKSRLIWKLCLFILAAASLSSSFLKLDNPVFFGPILFVCCTSCGALGALMRLEVSNLIHQKTGRILDLSTSISLGALAGFISTLLAIVPILAIGDNLESLTANANDYRSLILITGTASILSGLALDIFFLRFLSKNIEQSNFPAPPTS